jgi:hypothetical protein
VAVKKVSQPMLILHGTVDQQTPLFAHDPGAVERWS